MAGKIEYLAPVKSASGMIMGKKEKFVAVKRSTGKRQNGCAVVGKRNLVTNPYSDAELYQHDMIRTVSKNASARLNPTSETYAADIAGFTAQRNQPGCYKLFYEYLRADEFAKYKAAHPKN